MGPDPLLGILGTAKNKTVLNGDREQNTLTDAGMVNAQQQVARMAG